ARHVPPDLLRRKRQNRRQPPRHGLGDPVQRRLRGTAWLAVRACRVEAGLDDVEVEASEIDYAEVVDLLVDEVKLVVAVSGDDISLKLARALGGPAGRAGS